MKSHDALGMTQTEIIFFHVVLCLGFVTKAMFITAQCFGYCT